MPKFRLNLTGPGPLFFPAYGELDDGAIVEAAEQPGDGGVWRWTKAGKATADVAEPVVPDTADGPRLTEPVEASDPK